MTFIRSRTCMLAFSTLLATFVFSGSSPAQGAAVQEDAKRTLPDFYPYVAADILGWCRPQAGVWVDLGSGAGGVGLAVASSGIWLQFTKGETQ